MMSRSRYDANRGDPPPPPPPPPTYEQCREQLDAWCNDQSTTTSFHGTWRLPITRNGWLRWAGVLRR
jgi:hypothetical protein